MGEAALTILTGTILYAGAHHLYLGTTRTSTQPHLQLAAMYMLLAGFLLASALMYQPLEISAQAQLARLSMTMGTLLWIVLIWYVAFYTGSKPLLLLDLLTAAWAIFLIRNLSPPHGLLTTDIAPVDRITLSGQYMAGLYAGAGSWWTAVQFTMLASLLYCFYASLRMFRQGNRQAALALVSGLSILVAASLTSHLLNTRVIHALYFASFGFIGFLLANSVHLILLDYRNRKKAIQAPVIYRLAFNPEQSSFNNKLAYLQIPPPGDESEVAVAQAPESAAATDRKTPPSGERGYPGVQGESPWQPPSTALSKRDQPALNTVSDNLIDIAVYATMAINRFKRGDADPQVLQTLCGKIRTKAIKTRRMANRLSRPGS